MDKRISKNHLETDVGNTYMRQTLDSLDDQNNGLIAKKRCTIPHQSDFSKAAISICLAAVMTLSGCAVNQKQSDKTLRADPPLTQSPVPMKEAASPETQTEPLIQTTSNVELLTSAPDQYIVKKGDTLWDISARFLADPWYWPEIWHVNPEIKNPHLIYPGDVISLYYVNGQPRLSINQPMMSSSDGKLSPRVRSTGLTAENAGIPIDSLRPFLIRPQIITEEQLKTAAHILDSDENRLIFGSNDKVYARNLPDSQERTRYSVFRPGDELRDPSTDELLGFEAIYAGDAIVEVSGDPATVRLVDTSREILRGDRLLPMDAGATGMHFWPHAPKASIQGQIVSIFDALSQVAQYQIIAINLGKRDSIEPGHVFAIKQKGKLIKDHYHRSNQSKEVRLPDEKTGLAMVFRTFEKISYALIMKSSRTIRQGDVVSNP